MRGSLRGALFGVLAAVGSGASAAPVQLAMHGSNTIGGGFMPELVAAWAQARGYAPPTRETLGPVEQRLYFVGAGGRELEVLIASHGTGSGLQPLLDGTADFWMASRPAKDSEIAQARSRLGLPLADAEQEHVVALDGLAIIVHPSNGLSSLSVAQLRDVFSGKLRSWSDLGGPPGQIRLHARDDQSGTYDTFKHLVLGDTALRGDAARYESNSELAAQVAADPQAIGFTAFSAVGSAKALAIADGDAPPLMPDTISVATEDYLLARRLFLYSGKQPSETARDFLAFALSDAGQQVAEQAGFVSQAIRAAEAVVREDAPEEYRERLADARRLSLNLRFRPGSGALDSRAIRDIERLAEYMNDPQNAGRALRLAGFAGSDSTKVYAYLLSNDRVEYAVQVLSSKGVRTDYAYGYGDALPVASNDSGEGRSRNERVEVWIGPQVDRRAADQQGSGEALGGAR